MTTAITSLASGAAVLMPAVKLATAPAMLNKATAVALPAIALFAASKLQAVKADFASCFHDCAVVNKMNSVICGIICAAAELFKK